MIIAMRQANGLFDPFIMQDDPLDNSFDHLDRDCDEAYEPDAADDLGDDYDGQPDEAQEWHDFDPDC